jgi:quinohemoprotein ethanol dehydrogenase
VVGQTVTHVPVRTVYIPAMHKTLVYSDEKISDDFKMSPFNIGFAVEVSLAEDQPDHPASLQAWDPIKERAVWTVTHDHFWNAGTLTTGGDLVFQGLADGQFNAYHARTGERLWSYDAGLGISAPGITYKLEGEQYVAVLVGWGGGYVMDGETRELGWAYRAQHRRLIAFSLEGETEVPPQPKPFFPKPLDPKDFEIDDALVTLGESACTTAVMAVMDWERCRVAWPQICGLHFRCWMLTCSLGLFGASRDSRRGCPLIRISRMGSLRHSGISFVRPLAPP